MADHIGELIHDSRNARRHTPRNVGMIADALNEVGAARSIVIDEDNIILAGNATIDAAAQAGIEGLRIIDADGDEIIAVRRSNLTPEQKRRLALFDNRAAELAEWDPAILESMVGDTDLTGLFRDDELAAILATIDTPKILGDPDAVPDPPDDPITKPGDLWLLGRHRLLCGDATVAADVERLLNRDVPSLMVVDPPYGVEYEPDWRNDAIQAGNGRGAPGGRAVGLVTNDDRADWREAWSLFPGDVAYVWHSAVRAAVVAEGLIASGYDIRAQIIWAKSHIAISRGHYHWQHEPCWYAVKSSRTAGWIGDRKQTTLWEIDKPQKSETGHSAQKPVECMLRPIRNHSGDVYDPFLGSGTTMIAAEMSDRSCYGMEIDPRYCDGIVNRWQDFTGQTASREAAS